MGYSPWGCKGWDTIEQLGTHFTSTPTLTITSPGSTSCLNLFLSCGCDSGNLFIVEFPFLWRHTQKAILFILTTVLSLDNSSSRLFYFLKISQVIKGSEYFGTSLSCPKPTLSLSLSPSSLRRASWLPPLPYSLLLFGPVLQPGVPSCSLCGLQGTRIWSSPL